MTKTIFITGASTGLGRASAQLFAAKGWKVIATMRDPSKETELQTTPNVTVLALDVTDSGQIADAAAKALAMGPVDVLFNNAGYGLAGAFEGATDEQLTRQLDTNLLGVMRVTQAFLPAMRERGQGTIVTTTSIGGLVTFPFNSVYHATKWGLEGWSESLAFELEPFGLRVKTVAPGGIATDFASRSLVISGGATLIAARKVRAKLIKIAGHMLEAAESDIVLEDGAAKVAGTDRSVTVAAMAREIYTQTHRFKGELEPGLSESGTYDPPGTFSNACHIAIVQLDPETGFVKVERYLVAEDAGRIINPMIADGQVHGGIAQGIGNALLEEIVYDDAGGILTANLADYMPPTAHEMPPIELHHMETPSTQSITKAKGLGEGGTIGAPAAVLNAINDALTPFNVEIDTIPATPQRLRAAIREATAKQSA